MSNDELIFTPHPALGLTPSTASWPTPPANLAFDGALLRFERIVPAEAERGLVAYYHFRILVDASEVGHISFRVGDTEHVRFCAGHIGYNVLELFRGHNYAFRACRALAPFVRSIYPAVLLTCNPDNLPSLRIFERLGAVFIDEVPVPVSDPGYLSGSRVKRRFLWTPTEIE